MYEFPSKGRKAYRIDIYNKDVRAALKENRSHTAYRDDWANTQSHEILAIDEDDAREIMTQRYRPEEGFVIEAVALDQH